jgi:hypothetical protein
VCVCVCVCVVCAVLLLAGSVVASSDYELPANYCYVAMSLLNSSRCCCCR